MPVLTEDGKPRKRSPWPLWLALLLLAALLGTAIALPFVHTVFVPRTDGSWLFVTGIRTSADDPTPHGFSQESGFLDSMHRYQNYCWRVGTLTYFVQIGGRVAPSSRPHAFQR